MFKKYIIFPIVISILILLPGVTILYANGDDDHSMDGTNKVETHQEPYAEGYTSNFEAVVTLGNIKPNVQTNQKIYLSDYKTNAPVENAKIQVEITGVDNSKITTPIQIEPGIYEFSVEFPELKKYDLLFNVTVGDVNDLIAMNEVDLAHSEKTDIAETTSGKSIFVRVFENWLWIILFVILISMIAFIFYRIGKRSNSKIILPQTYDSTTKYDE